MQPPDAQQVLEETPDRVWVFRTGALGDFLLTLPAVRALREAFPDAALTIAGRPSTLALAAPLFDAAEDLDAARWATMFSPDAALSEELLGRIAGAGLALSYLSDADGLFARNLRRAGARSVVTHTPHPPGDGSVHIVDHLLRPIESLGLPIPSRLPTAAVSQNALDDALRLVPESAAPYAVLHPGSGGARKCWPTERFARVADDLSRRGLVPIVTSGPADGDLPSRLAAAATFPVVLAKEMPLPSFAALLSRACVYVGNDSGPTHLAAAVGARVVAVFGPTDPRIWAPRGPNVRVVAAAGDLPPGQRLDAVSADQVLEAVDALISPGSA